MLLAAPFSAVASMLIRPDQGRLRILKQTPPVHHYKREHAALLISFGFKMLAFFERSAR